MGSNPKGTTLHSISHHVLGCDDWTIGAHTVSHDGTVRQITLGERRVIAPHHCNYVPRATPLACMLPKRSSEGLILMGRDRPLASKIGGRRSQEPNRDREGIVTWWLEAEAA
jgi:hypothetical protein